MDASGDSDMLPPEPTPPGRSPRGGLVQLGLRGVEHHAAHQDDGEEEDGGEDASDAPGAGAGSVRALRYLEWTTDPDPEDTTYQVDYAVMLRADDGTIDVTIDGCIGGGAGTSIGTCEVMSTGGADTFAPVTCTLTETSGAHDLCLKFSGSPAFEIDSFHLE